MNFFDAQEQARKRTGRMVFLFALAVLGTVLAAYLAALFILGANRGHGGRGRFQSLLGEGGLAGLWHPQLLLAVTVLVGVIVGFASLYKWSQLRSGGKAVAEMLGGRQIEAGRANQRERMLLNVVEEMAIASGLPVPGVFVLDEEEGLNAFAAGLGNQDAVVAVTRGTLEKLNRDELQGVIAHEFSHILNGDMRMNLRLTSVLFGILVLGVIGRGLLQVSGRGRRLSSGRNKDSGGNVLLLIGIALLVIGYVGYFFGRLIQASVSRQREYLADASAVQFTRNPLGISSALKKIGANAQRSGLDSSHAAEFSHLFFAEGVSSFFGGAFATHPPLEHRIRAIEPGWDGQFLEASGAAGAKRASQGLGDSEVQASAHVHTHTHTHTQALKGDAQERGFPLGEAGPERPENMSGMLASLLGGAALNENPRNAAAQKAKAPSEQKRLPHVPEALIQRAGALTEQHFEKARDLLQGIPPVLKAAAEAQEQAPSLLAALLMHGETLSHQQLVAPLSADHLARFHDLGKKLAQELRLPLVQVAIPALRTLKAPERVSLLDQLRQIAAADGQTSPFEFALLAMVSRSLAGRHPGGGVAAGTFSFTAVAGDFAVLLSLLARCSSAGEQEAQVAMATGVSRIKLLENELSLLPLDQCQPERLFAALEHLGQASLPIRKRFLDAGSHVVGSDGSVSLDEAELLRAMALALDCPLPLWD